jgi:hypothetical protein
LPPALFFGFFALPFGRDQPTEVWALAKLRFWFKPRVRIWNQSGVKELVTITVPKRVEHVFTNGLSQTEVRSRLQALANTIDSRGWAVKNVNVNAYAAPGMLASSSDRLIDVSSIPQAVPDFDVQASEDMLDEANSPVAQQFDNMINQASQAHRQQLVQQMNSGTVANAPQADYWFMHPGQASDVPSSIPAPKAADLPNEAELASQLKASSRSHPTPYNHLRTVRPLGSKPPEPALPAASTPAVTAPSDPAILALAENNDHSVATLAREAHKAKGGEDKTSGEVNVPLR